MNIVPKNQSVTLDTIVGEVVAKFFDRALRSDIDLGAEVRPVTLIADPSLLDDLLSNLVDNALKYTPAGGTVTVSAGENGGKRFIAVEDTGAGIPEKERERVKQRFYRIPNSPGHGSGLGLAIVDEIAQLYGASLTIGSGANGVGTRVVLQFP
jgi:two-component system sensor histidine kinase TctE